jgi:hypothetical protein
MPEDRIRGCELTQDFTFAGGLLVVWPPFVFEDDSGWVSGCLRRLVAAAADTAL